MAGVDDDSACWWPGSPCATVQHALDTYVETGAGTSVRLHGGRERVYDPFVLRAAQSGAPDRPTWIGPWPNTGRPIVDGTEGDGLNAGAIRGCCGETTASHFVIEGLEVRNGPIAGILVHGSGSEGAVIRDCVVHSTRIIAGDIYENQLAGIAVSNDVPSVVIEDNVIRDNPAVDGSRAISGIAVTDGSHDALIRRNLIRDNSGDGIEIASGSIDSNRITDVGRHGILVSSTAMVANNVVCSSGEDGIRVVNGDDGVYTNNTVAGAGGSGMTVTSWATGNRVSDSVFAFNAVAAFERELVLDAMGMPRTGDASDPVEEHNLLFGNGSDYLMLEPDAPLTNLTSDPGFADLEACDLRASGTSLGAMGWVLSPIP
jgi:hypothetical protein